MSLSGQTQHLYTLIDGGIDFIIRYCLRLDTEKTT